MTTSRSVLFALLLIAASGAAAQSPEAELQPGDWVRIQTADSLLYGLVLEAENDSLFLEVDGRRSQAQSLSYADMDALSFALANSKLTGALNSMFKWGGIMLGTSVVTYYFVQSDFIQQSEIFEFDRGTGIVLVLLAQAAVPAVMVVAGIVGASNPGYTWQEVQLRESIAVGVMGSGLGLRVRL